MAILVPTLAVTDLETGGGVSAAITGATAGTTNTLYTQAVPGDLGTAAWTAVGSRVGSGSLTVTVDKGYYHFHVLSTLGADVTASNIVYQKVTDGQDAVQERILAAVAARIGSLLLPGLTQVYRLKVPFRDVIAYPSIVVTDFNQSETVLGGTTQRDDIGRPVYVVFATKTASQQQDAPQYHLWRQMVWRAFSYQRLPGVAEVDACFVEPAVIGVTDPNDTERYEGALALRFKCREPRGFAA